MMSAEGGRRNVSIFTLDSDMDKNPMSCLIAREMERQRSEAVRSSGGDSATLKKMKGVNAVVIHTPSLIQSIRWIKSVIPVALVDDTALRGYWSPVSPTSPDRLRLPGWSGLSHWPIRIGRLSVKKERDITRIARQIIFTTRRWADLDPNSRAPWEIYGPFTEVEAISPEIITALDDHDGKETTLPVEEMR